MDPFDLEKILQTLRDLQTLADTGKVASNFIKNKVKAINKIIKVVDKTDDLDTRVLYLEKVVLEVRAIMRKQMKYQIQQDDLHNKHLNATLHIIEQLEIIKKKTGI